MRPRDLAHDRVPGAAFEAQYQASRDPWDFATSSYEQRRYDLTVAMLPPRRYRRGFEPGCSIGELTARLAARCDCVVALDCSPTAVARARARCRAFAHVTVSVGELPEAWPSGTFDLVVLSELGYYFPRGALAALVARSAAVLEPGGALLAVHWRGHSSDHVLHGDEVHEVARTEAANCRLFLAGSYVETGFRADVWTKEES